MTLANHYAAVQKIPVENLIYVDLPPSVLQAESVLSEQEFRKHVIEPVQAALEERGLSERILAWVYSGDFPVLIKGSPHTSLTGFTYFQGALPSPSDVTSGKKITPFFAGLQDQSQPGYPFIAFRQTLKKKMPVPSMMLAHLGARGLTLLEAIDMIDRSRLAEGSRPEGTVYFERGSDVRAKTREFQFEESIDVLSTLGLKGEVLEGLPTGRKKVLGVLAGRTMVPPRSGGILQPGAYADHLTSFAADFDMYHHTKCTDWLRYGASGTSGPVVEPMAIWTKFPSARIFEFYARGFSMIESMYLSLGSPYQTLLMGDPLCAPYNQRLPLTLLPISGDILQGSAVLQGHPLSSMDPKKMVWRLSIDGVPQGGLHPNPVFTIDTTQYSDGVHRFGVEGYVAAQPLRMGYAEQYYEVSNFGRKATLVVDGVEQDSSHPFVVTVKGTEGAMVAGLEVNGRLLKAEAVQNDGAFEVTLPAAQWGQGMVALQGVVQYQDGMEVRSPATKVTLKNLNQPPKINLVKKRISDEGIQITATAVDPEGDTSHVQWSIQLLKSIYSSTQNVERVDAALNLRPNPEKLSPVGLIRGLSGPVRRLRAQMTPRNFGIGIASGDRFGLVYHDQGPGTFSFFGYGGANGSWVLADVKAGKWSIRKSMGRPVFMNTEYQLEVKRDASGMLVASVDGFVIFREACEYEDLGICGLFAERYSSASKLWVNASALESVSVDLPSGALTMAKPKDSINIQSLEVRAVDDLGAISVKEVK